MRLPTVDWIAENDRRALWFKEREGSGWNCYYFPQGWASQMSDGVDHDVPEVYGYAPLHAKPNSEVDTMWIPCSDLDQKTESTEAECRALHPNLGLYLDAINAGVDVHNPYALAAFASTRGGSHGRRQAGCATCGAPVDVATGGCSNTSCSGYRGWRP